MTTYKSDIKVITASEEKIFNLISDLNHLQILNETEKPIEKFRILEYDRDSCVLAVDKFGEVGIHISERHANKLIRFNITQLPVEAMGEIFLDESVENTTQFQVAVQVELSWTLKMMLNKQLEKGINIFADLFEDLLNQWLIKNS
jgi:hypothetical protein